MFGAASAARFSIGPAGIHYNTTAAELHDKLEKRLLRANGCDRIVTEGTRGAIDMIYTDKTKQAVKLCHAAHKEQTDKSGIPWPTRSFP